MFLGPPKLSVIMTGGCSLYELIGDGTFFRCIRKEVVNAAGTEVIVILCVAILVLAVVAGVLAYEWRVQGGGRVGSRACSIAQFIRDAASLIMSLIY